MSKEMIISVNGREKKIAILDNGKVTEFYIERGEENAGVVGNIYKGRVMRVLPGMQSAFVEIGLERDAFLYVSDFFDEEEEIERIVMEKSKKTSPEEAKREAVDQIERARIERDKQMESVQDIAEPLAHPEGGDAGMPAEEEGRIFDPQLEPQADDPQLEAEPEPEPERKGRGRRRGKKGKETEETAETEERVAPETPSYAFETEDSGFERIVDDEDTGEMFKDAYMQEAIVDKVRAIEFAMESTRAAEVGSVLSSVRDEPSGFERIADEDEDVPAPPAKGRKRGGKGKKAETEAAAEAAPEAGPETEEADGGPVQAKTKAKRGAKAKTGTFKKPSKSKKAAGEEGSEDAAAGKSSKGKKKASSEEGHEDAEASVRESDSGAEMTVRRGGRGRRRGGRARRAGEGEGEGTEGAEGTDENFEFSESEDFAPEENQAAEAETEVAASRDVPAEEPAEREQPARERSARERPASASDRERPAPAKERNEDDGPKRGSRGKDSRSPDSRPPERGASERGPSERGPSERGPRERDTRDRDRSRNGGKRNDRSDRGGYRERPPQPTITDLLKEGQEILVQIAKEPIARKGARITSHIALPGRFLVYMPTIEHLGVSRKIESSSERARLRTLIQRIRQDTEIPSGGFIVRTAGIGISEEDLKNDAKYLVRTWLDVKKTSEKAKSPAMVHQDLDIVQRILRDQMSDDFTAIRVDSEEEYERTVEFVNRMAPRMVNRVKLYTREEPILEAFGVQEEIEKALKPRVWLKSGGYLVINQTEALVAIDVNTGKFVGKGNARLEDTITRTNMEAVDEIARQIRLRDLGGIIVLDLIDMEDRRNRHKVSQALQEALSSDKSPTKVLSFNDFGLIIMTRKRVKQSLERTMCAPCDYCEGAGWVKSPQTVCFEILEEARRLAKSVDDVRQTTLRVHPDVAKALRSTERVVLEEIEAYLGNVDITADPAIHQTQFDFAFI
jgi:ribonuclease G